jgi:hypothetical protein
LRAEHKVCSNIFLTIRLGGELVIKINGFINLYSLVKPLSISNTLEMEGVLLFYNKEPKVVFALKG